VKHTDWIEPLYEHQPWDDSLEIPLKKFGLNDPKKAWNNLLILVGQANYKNLFPEFFPSLMDCVSKSYNADIALHNFERFTGKILDKNYLVTLLSKSPEFLHSLVILFSGSQVLTDTLMSEPAHFDWLIRPETLHKSKSKDALMRDFYELAGAEEIPENTPKLLRLFKKREYIRIGLRDLLRQVEMKETVRDIANIADICLAIAYEYADRLCRKRYGVPWYEDGNGQWEVAEFSILGMGKLGGCELNYSSDIDLIYIYTSSKGETRKEEEGEPIISISCHEYFTRLAQLVTKTIHEITEDGNVFRVDLDLRPEGRSGEIVNSLASCEIYYESWGRTWERQALLKARASAGSETLARTFLTMLEPFIYRRSLDFSAIEEIKAMKIKINESLKGKKTGEGNIKLGFGGIREIEFIVQSYQLIFGGQDKSLRVANTLQLLDRLLQLKFIKPEDYQHLREAYIFLRNLENRVQISFGLQTHSLPKGKEQLISLARKMGFQDETAENLPNLLMQEFERHTLFVGEMFAGLFVDEKKEEAEESSTRSTEEQKFHKTNFQIEHFQEFPFSDPGRALRFLKSMRDGPEFSHPSEKSIQDFYEVLPKILNFVKLVPKPNSAVENLVKFVEASGARETYLNLFNSNEKFLDLLLILFGGSDMLSQILVKQPDLVDVLMDLESIYRFKPPIKIAEDLERGLKRCGDLESKNIYLRRSKNGEELRIGIRYLIHEADLMGTLADLSSLADVYLQSVFQIACEQLRQKSGGGQEAPENFAIIGLGKLGGNELNFGSDLDIIFVYDNGQEEDSASPEDQLITHYSALSQMIYQLTSEMTSAGFAYKIDTELRPEGGSGVLVLSLKGYQEYFQHRARIWEQQAMTRARFVAGDRALGAKFLQAAHEFTYRRKLEYGSLIEISRLRERMEKELANEFKKGKNVKLGYGGLADIEFILQILQLMHAGRHPRLRETNSYSLIKLFADHGILDLGSAEQLQEHYLFLRNLECALRIAKSTASSHLPKDEESLAVVSRLLGYENQEPADLAKNLIEDYTEVTEKVRQFYRQNLDMLLRTSL